MKRQTPLLEVSKWVSLFALLNLDDLKDLFNSISPFTLAYTGRIALKNTLKITADYYCRLYENYLTHFQKSPELNCSLSQHEEAFETKVFSNDKEMCIAKEPVIIIKLCAFSYSKEDRKFHTEVFGKAAIPFGLHFAFPQLFRDPKDGLIKNPYLEKLPNAESFKQIRRFLRHHSKPAQFVIEGHKITAPLRLSIKPPSLIDHPLSSHKELSLVSTD